MLDTLALWLRFLAKREVGRLRRTSQQLNEHLEGVALLVEPSTDDPCDEQACREVVFMVCTQSPRILYADNFLTAEECQALIAMARVASSARASIKPRLQARQLRHKHYVATPSVMSDQWTWLPSRATRLLRHIEQRICAVTSCPPSNEEGETLEINYTPARYSREDMPSTDTLDGTMWMSSEVGVHVDVNNGYPHRFVTALCYLNSVSTLRGGATCFPAAGEQNRAIRNIATSLLRNGVYHTDAALRQDYDEALFDSACKVVAAASALCGDEKAPAPVAKFNPGIRIQPRTGAVCLFWSLDDDGDLDARTFHGGCRVLTESVDNRRFWHQGKWTLQSFKQVPVTLRAEQNALDRLAFLHTSRRCLAGAAGGIRFTVIGNRA